MIRASLLLFMPLFAMLFWAAIQDMRTRRIRNELTLMLVLTGLLQSCTAVGTVSLSHSAMGLGAGFCLGFVLFALGGMGGGDVKLLAGVGAWIGPLPVVAAVAVAAVIGVIFVLFNAIRDGQLKRLMHSTTVLVVNTVQIRQLGIQQALQTSRSHISVGRPLPYAVPVLLAVVIVVQLGV
jgi:prepilin peptidase CpaA